MRWDRERTRALTTPIRLFITVRRRGRDSSYQRAGARYSPAVLAEILETLGALAELPDALRHPHALRHTCATHLLQHGANVADVAAPTRSLVRG
jgi:integrase